MSLYSLTAFCFLTLTHWWRFVVTRCIQWYMWYLNKHASKYCVRECPEKSRHQMFSMGRQVTIYIAMDDHALTRYSIEGAYSYYQALLKPLLQYGDLSTEVQQVFRVIGNTFIVIHMLDAALVWAQIGIQRCKCNLKYITGQSRHYGPHSCVWIC